MGNPPNDTDQSSSATSSLPGEALAKRNSSFHLYQGFSGQARTSSGTAVSANILKSYLYIRQY